MVRGSTVSTLLPSTGPRGVTTTILEAGVATGSIVKQEDVWTSNNIKARCFIAAINLVEIAWPQ